MAAQRKISLLPQEGFEFTTLGRVVTWSLGVGRIIVVVTELIVIGAFLSRFWLDRRLTDLNEKISQQVALVKTYQKFENDWNRAQEKLKKISLLKKTQVNLDGDLKLIIGVIPENIALTQLNLGKDTVQMSGVATYEGAVDVLINNLTSLKLGDVELTNLSVSTNDQLGVKFTIVITREIAQNGQKQ